MPEFYTKTVSWEFSPDFPSIAVVTIDNPPVNAYGAQVAKDLVLTFQNVWNHPKVQASILIGHGKNFMAGADIAQLMVFSESLHLLEKSECSYRTSNAGLHQRVQYFSSST